MNATEKKDDHSKHIKIVVNGREHETTQHELSFEEIVALAFPNPSTDDTYTVTYRKADGKKTDGTLTAGGTVRIKDGTIFNVTATHKS